MKEIAILGSTGSIGTQTLEVIRSFPDQFKVSLITAFNNDQLLIKQALQFEPEDVIIGNTKKYERVKNALSSKKIRVHSGLHAINDLIKKENIDIVVTAMVGYSGLKPTISAIEAGKDIALANKETLVVAGDIIMSMAHKYNVMINPVDSEHSAIFQCLVGEKNSSVENIFLTASGGPFRGKTFKELKNVTVKDALNHPNWDMGSKITIDSASLMNKGLEAIEAKWLFDLTPEQIEVVIHPQSIIHSMVQFKDGSIKAQMGLPDMRVPIQYALTYPERWLSDFPRCNFFDFNQLTFEKPDVELFRNLKLAYHAMKAGGNMPAAMNAANEIAVEAFLEERIKFIDIPSVIENTMDKIDFTNSGNLDDYCLTDASARDIAITIIK